MFSIGAIIFMWFLYPKQYDYKAQLDKGMFFYQANMVRRCRQHTPSWCSLASRPCRVLHIRSYERIRTIFYGRDAKRWLEVWMACPVNVDGGSCFILWG